MIAGHRTSDHCESSKSNAFHVDGTALKLSPGPVGTRYRHALSFAITSTSSEPSDGDGVGVVEGVTNCVVVSEGVIELELDSDGERVIDALSDVDLDTVLCK